MVVHVRSLLILSLALGFAACGPRRPVLGIAEFPPTLPDRFGDMPVNGGRTYSIAVNPSDSRVIVLSTQWGGLWKTIDGGGRWEPITRLPAVFSVDVAWSNDGRTLIATIGRDNRKDNGGGIWVSGDRGASWSRPPSAIPPAHAGVPARISASGISFAPFAIHRRGRVYVGTDYGIAISDDAGVTWRHELLDAITPVGAVSVLALPGDVVIALSSAGVHRSNDGGATWTRIRDGNFASGFKNLDNSPNRASQVLVLQDVSTLFLYNADSGTFTKIPLPAGSGRGPFVRLSRLLRPRGSIVIWVGNGVALLRVTVGPGAVSAIEAIRESDWQRLGRAEGLHDDSAYLGLDVDRRPVLYGSDGGIFRPTNDEATAWTNAASGRSGWNSLQITDLGGTNTQVFPNVFNNTLYFTTQDNGIWASTDGGLTWPNSDCAEGFHVEVSRDATQSEPVQVAYGKVGCGPSPTMFSDAGLRNARAAPGVDLSNNPVSKLSHNFRVAPDAWIRMRQAPDNHWEAWVSSNNGANWRKRYDFALPLEPRGVFQCVGFTPARPSTSARCYLPVKGSARTPSGDERIGLLYFARPMQGGVTNINESSIRFLPDNGSLGIRVTEFDWQAVFGASQNYRILIAPDIVNNVVRISRDEGQTWTSDANATNVVTMNGELLMLDTDPWHMLVTHVAFDPYNANRVLIGTRESGVVMTDDDARSWRRIRRSESLLQATGFVFKRDDTVIASAYGRGLWVIDLRYRPRITSPIFDCPPCRYLEILTGRVLPSVSKDVDSLVAFGGFVTGARINGRRLREINLSAGANFGRYLDDSKSAFEIPVTTKDHSEGLRRAVRGLLPGEYVKGFVLEGDRVLAAVVGPESFRGAGAAEPPPDDNAQDRDDPPLPPRPYVVVTSETAVSGLTIVGPDEPLRIQAGGFVPGVPVRVLLDDESIEYAQTVVDQDGRLAFELKSDAALSLGQHRLEIGQSGPDGERRALTRFLKLFADDFGPPKRP